MKDMTLKEALAEAVRLWGASGTVRMLPVRQGRTGRGRLARYRCTVGNGAAGSRASVEGQGNTWREAFADARSR